MKTHNKNITAYFTFIITVLVTLACNQLLIKPPPPTELIATTAPPTKIIQPTETYAPNAGAPGIGDSLFPGFGNGGYQVDHYTLDITVNDVSTSDLTATTAIDAQATQDLSSFNLDFIGFDITSLKVNDTDAEFSRNGQELTVKPSTLLTNNEKFTVEVQYSGSPQKMDSIAIPIQTGWVTFPGGSYVLSEPDGAASYFPVNDHPLDKATYSFRVTVPKPFEAAANGILTQTIDNGATTTFLFEARDPMASYLSTVDIDQFNAETSKSPKGIPIRNYYASDLPKDINKPFAKQGEMLDYFSKLFGAYPFEVYGALVINTHSGAALENQTMSIFGVDMIDLQDIPGSEEVVAHEMVHQWFGDSVSVADWSDIWLNEGFATYGEGLWVEHTDGRKALDTWVKAHYKDAENSTQYFPAPGKPPATDLFNGGVYYRGGLTLHALRLKVGDETFFKILQTYFERYKGCNASTDDFIHVAEDVSEQDLKEFFNDWLYQDKLMPIPELGLGK